MLEKLRLSGVSIILAVGLLLCSCEKSVEMVDCVTIENGLLAFDETLQNKVVLDELNKLRIDLKPEVTADDAFGHKENFNKLISRLNKSCTNFNVELVTYATIKTNPVQSEIRMTLLKNNVHYIIDIHTPEDDVLKAVNIHK